MARTPPSDSLRELVRDARRAGAEGVTARQIESWQQEGLAYQPEVTHLGRAGSDARYPPGALEQVVLVGELLRRERDYDRVALRLFGRGSYVREDRLREAYDSVFSSSLRQARAVLTTLASERAHSPEIDRTMRTIRRLSAVRGWKRRLGRDPTGLLLRSVVTETLMVLVEGSFQDPDNLGLVWKALGGEQIAESLEPGEQHLALSQAALVAIRGLAKSTSLSRLEWARDCTWVMVEYSKYLELAMKRTGRLDGIEGMSPVWFRAKMAAFSFLGELDPEDGLSIALFAPVVAGVAGLRGRRAPLEETVASCRKGSRQLRAVIALTDDLDPKYWPCVGVGGVAAVAQLSEGEREGLVNSIRAWCDRHPEEAIGLREWASG